MKKTLLSEVGRANRPFEPRLGGDASPYHLNGWIATARFVCLTMTIGFGSISLRADETFFATRVTPILERHCTVCHGASKQKAGLRLDSFELAMRGGESGAVIKEGDLAGSDLLRRIKLPDGDDEAMPSDGKPRLTPDEIKIVELWIAGGASPTKTLADFPDAPALPQAKLASLSLAPDWRPRAAEIAALEKSLGIRLAPRSQMPGDGLVLRTASAPARCDDAALARLGPVAELIVEAELARTKVTDAGLKSVAGWSNLRRLDLTRTAVTSAGAMVLTGLSKLEALNLTGTAVENSTVARLREMPALKRLWIFGTPADVAGNNATAGAK